MTKVLARLLTSRGLNNVCHVLRPVIHILELSGWILYVLNHQGWIEEEKCLEVFFLRCDFVWRGIRLSRAVEPIRS